MSSIDQLELNFDPQSLWLLNICLAFIMFGVALDLRSEDFKQIINRPKAVLTGIASQFMLLPALTFLLVWVIEPHPSLALGMMLVAACPGGNISNFIVHLAKGNTALSVTLTAIATCLAVVMTPLNFKFWSGLMPASQAFDQVISISFLQMFQTIALLIGVPLILGMLFASKLPALTQKITKPIKSLSILIFGAFIGIAFFSNRAHFMEYIHLVFLLVLAHNALGLLTGYWFSRSTGLNSTDARSISIETGIQNSGLGLILIFNFFGGLGGMALVAAWWGIWHILSGLILAWYWSKQTPKK